jgi:hypothetical protein
MNSTRPPIVILPVVEHVISAAMDVMDLVSMSATTVTLANLQSKLQRQKEPLVLLILALTVTVNANTVTNGTIIKDVFSQIHNLLTVPIYQVARTVMENKENVSYVIQATNKYGYTQVKRSQTIMESHQ